MVKEGEGEGNGKGRRGEGNGKCEGKGDGNGKLSALRMKQKECRPDSHLHTNQCTQCIVTIIRSTHQSSDKDSAN